MKRNENGKRGNKKSNNQFGEECERGDKDGGNKNQMSWGENKN